MGSVTTRSDRVAMVMLFLIGIAFALTFVFNRIAITSGIPLIPYVAWQAVGGALILLIICGVNGEFPEITPQSKALFGDWIVEYLYSCSGLEFCRAESALGNFKPRFDADSVRSMLLRLRLAWISFERFD